MHGVGIIRMDRNRHYHSLKTLIVINGRISETDVSTKG